MAIAMRALQAVLMFFAFGAMVTALVVGILVVAGTDGCSVVPENNSTRPCVNHQAKATGAIGIGVAGVASGLLAVALNGMARPKPQVQNTLGNRPLPSGPYPQQPPYGPPR